MDNNNNRSRMGDSSFKKVFGDSPFIKVMDFLLNTDGNFDYSLTEIAKKSGISWATMSSIYKQFIDLGIIKQRRTVGRAKMFVLNVESPMVKVLKTVDDMVTSLFVEIKLAKMEGKKVKMPSLKLEPMKIKT
ncbi:MAG: hypothetical protein ABIJ92_00805 [Candidatus Aenigmatarchaeota archaeon]